MNRSIRKNTVAFFAIQFVVISGASAVDVSSFPLQRNMSAPADTDIPITFSEVMKPDCTNHIAVSINGADGYPIGRAVTYVAGTWSSKDNKTFIFDPARNLDKGDLVVVNVSRDLTDAKGNAYTGEDNLFSFMVDSGVHYGFREYEIETLKKENNGTHNIPLKIMTPKGEGPFPVMFFVHGGGWKGGTPEESMCYFIKGHSELMADQVGVATVAIAYRCMGSKGTFAQAMKDIHDAVDYVRTHAAEYDLDMSRCGFVGGSAGTPLSSLAVMQTPEASCYIGFNGIYNLKEHPLSKFPNPPTRYDHHLPDYEANSAIFHIKKDAPDTLLMVGSKDTTTHYMQSVKFAEKLREAGGNATALVYKDEVHAFFHFDKQLGPTVFYELRNHLKRVFEIE